MAVGVLKGELPPDFQPLFVIRVDSIKNCSVTGTIMEPATNNTGSVEEYDGMGAVMYVAAVVVICSISIILMIASSVRRNHADRYIAVYLRQIELVRKKNYKEAFLYAHSGKPDDTTKRMFEDMFERGKNDKCEATSGDQTRSLAKSTIGENFVSDTVFETTRKPERERNNSEGVSNKVFKKPFVRQFSLHRGNDIESGGELQTASTGSRDELVQVV